MGVGSSPHDFQAVFLSVVITLQCTRRVAEACNVTTVSTAANLCIQDSTQFGGEKCMTEVLKIKTLFNTLNSMFQFPCTKIVRQFMHRISGMSEGMGARSVEARTLEM